MPERTNKVLRLPPAFIVIGILLFLLALFPRTLGLNDFFTTDEAYHWIDRVGGFRYALSKGRWSETLLTGHPGVTIMWLGTIGYWLEDLWRSWGAFDQLSRLEHLAWLRFPAALFESILVPCAYLILRRIINPLAALFAALLWATSPYMIAHSRLLHLDALLASCVSFSLLCLLWSRQAALDKAEEQEGEPKAFQRLPFLLSAIFGGLALLTKGPALILLPCIGLSLIWLVPAPNFFQRIWRASLALGAWLLGALLCVFSLWPALWSTPITALTRYIEEITANGGRPNGDGQFFLGKAVDDPGPLFYLVANAFRATPELCLGLVCFLVWLIIELRARKLKQTLQAPQLRSLLILAGFVLFWSAVMTIGPKKFDRYVLPTWPSLFILAGFGFAWGSEKLVTAIKWPPAAKYLCALLIGLVALIPNILYHPHYLSYYNPLLGGGKVAQHNLLIGWGEGMEQVAAFLQSRSDLTYAPVASALGATLRPFLSIPVENIDHVGRKPVNYAVVYLESIQRNAYPEVYERIRNTLPIQRIQIHGIEYAEIYQVPRPYDYPLDAQFGTAIHLWGYSFSNNNDNSLTITPSWDVRDRIDDDYMLFVHLIDQQGNKIAQSDLSPAGDGPPTSTWEVGQQIAVPISLFPAEELKTGHYRIIIGLYHPETWDRLELVRGPHFDPAIAGDNALLLHEFQIP
jgi:4-amino-4-deoxy-L-arabinose transferase-like glycosyltransferase